MLQQFIFEDLLHKYKEDEKNSACDKSNILYCIFYNT